MTTPDPAETPIAIAVVEHGDFVLIGQRPPDVPLGGMWEFPGGKVQPHERPEEAAVRECLEETGLAVAVVRDYAVERYNYAHGTLRLHFFQCRAAACEGSDANATVATDRPPPVRAPFGWVRRAELARYEFPPANRTVLESLTSPTSDVGRQQG